MNDPFAMLNPIDKPKTAPVYNPPPSVPVAPLHPVGGGYGGPPAPGMGMGMPHAPMGMGMGMGPGMGMHMGGMPGGMPHGMGPGMGQGMPPGMGHGMGPGMGGGMPGGMPQQAPIMYDNIKQLLEQKPKPSGTMRDDAGMDFLEHLGTTKANSVSVTSPTAAAVPAVDPFGGPAPAPPTVSITAPPVSLAGFSFPGETTASPPTTSPSNSTKSSALADRLANGRRKTQEMQRESLGFNAGSFSPSSGAPKISLKELAPPTSNKSPSNGDRETRAPSLEDFASGKSGFQESDPFGMSAAPSGGRSSRTNSGSTSNQSKSTPAPATTSYTSSASGCEGGSFFADSDADFEKKLNGGAPSGSSRQLSSGNLDNATRTGSGGASAKTTMDFGW